MTNVPCKKTNTFAVTLGSLFGLAVTAAAGWIVYSRRYIDHHAKLRGVLDAEQHTYESAIAGKINYFVDRTGDNVPLLIVHGIHPTAGAHDIAPIFNAFSSQRPVYAINLPGFGGSEKSDRPYRPSLYQAAITDFIRDQIGQAADVVVLGLSSEFAALAARENPELFHSIIMINPTGMQMPQPGYVMERPGIENLLNLFYAVLAVPLWSLPTFDILASRPRIVQYYRKRFEYNIPEELVDLAYASAHQAGSHFAPIVALSGKLQTPNVRDKVYAALNVPVFVLYDNEPGARFDMLPFFVREHPNWKAQRIRQSFGMPYFDRPGETFKSMDMFWKQLKA